MTSPLSSPEVYGSKIVFKDYEIVNGYLRRRGHDETGSYRPQDREDLPFAIAKLVDASEADILRFARQWGLIGYAEVAWRDTDPKDRERPADPLDWIQLHARYIALCIALIQALGDRDEDAVRHAVQKFLLPDEPKPWDRPGLPLPRAWGLLRPVERVLEGLEPPSRRIWTRPIGETEVEPLVWGETLASEPLRAARLAVRDLVNRHIEGITPAVLMDGEEHTLQFTFWALVEIAYLHIAHLFIEGSRIDRCQECGSPFKKQHGHQRFCPSGPYDSESRCSYRHRYRRFRGKKGTREKAQDGAQG